jgi:hypothetical protein
MQQMANGDGNWHSEFMWGTVLMFFIGIYSWVAKHLWGHVTKDDLNRTLLEVEKMRDSVQYKDNCAEVVKRLDADSKQTHQMLERILNKLDGL